MSQSPERCRTPQQQHDSFSPSMSRILTGMICFCVPMLLLTSWQSTQRWKLNSIVMHEGAAAMNTTSRIAEEIDRFHFCGESHVSAQSSTNNSLTLLYQCAGPQYEDFAANLRSLAFEKSQESISNQPSDNVQEQCTATLSTRIPTSEQWGRRDHPLPDGATVLVLGNSHLRQISKTLACQYASSLKSIQFLPSLIPTSTQQPTPSTNSDGFILEFDNGARWISITNTVLAYSPHWKELIEDYFLSTLSLTMQDMDAVVFGKFTTYEEAQQTNFERMMTSEQEAYELILRLRPSPTSPEVDFATISPPDLADVDKVYNGPLLAVSMFSKSDSSRFAASYQQYQDECSLLLGSKLSAMNKSNIQLIDARRYIEEMQTECGTDDKNVLGTCNESKNAVQQDRRHLGATMMKRGRDASDMHRCAGEGGGHADLIAWDIVEGLHAKIQDNRSKIE